MKRALFRSRVLLQAEILILRHQHPATACAEESGLQCHGSPDLCWAVSFGAKCHQGADDRETRYRHPLASCWFQFVLALEIPAPLRPTNCPVGNSLADLKDEHRQPLWGALRIHGELLKLGIGIGQTSVAKYMARLEDVPTQPFGYGPLRIGPLQQSLYDSRTWRRWR